MKKLFQKLSGLSQETTIDLSAKNNNDQNDQEEYINSDELEQINELEQIEEEIEESENKQNKEEKEWLDDGYEEGQLSIDVYQTSKKIIVKSTIAGVRPEDIDISVNNDMLTIRGKRELNEQIREENYLFRECYWGGFSRSIILPVEIEAEKIEAILENGVLTIILPKAKSAQQISIKVKEK